MEVFNNIELVGDWGGATALFENPNEADLAICLIYVDSTGFWNQGETFYTKRLRGSVSTRGLQPKETKFGVYIRDRWDNTSDTLVKVLTPRFEKELDRLKFKEVRLPGDSPLSTAVIAFISAIWDGNYAKFDDLYANLYISNPDGNWPHWLTFDTGYEGGVLLSRCKLWQRGSTFLFQDRNIKKFEIWGSMDPNPDGSFDDSWTLLLDDEIIKPSGLPVGNNSDEDRQAHLNGFEFVFPLDMPLVRYIRIKVKETWGNQQAVLLMQFVLWGDEVSVDVPDDQ